MPPALTLYGENTWMSPWVFHVMVALEEKQLPYKLEIVPLPIPKDLGAKLAARAVLGKVPILAHDDVWISESLAISEYIAETFRFPDYPRIFPESLAERARARQVMSWLRTSLMGLRSDRPTTNVFGRPTVRPFTEKGRLEADELLRVATALITPGKPHMFATWSIADADLALALMRLIGSQDQVPQFLIEYALAQWDRRSIKRYVAHVPTTP
jgi:glutathione S-transferase